MKIKVICSDITTFHGDAIVNAASHSLLGGDGVDGAIHAAAGPELLRECRTLGGCRTGEAKITKGYRLPAKYVIHTVGPIWRGGNHREKELLESCYCNASELALDKGLKKVAFPLISAGAFGYPLKEAIRVAITTLMKYRTDEFDPWLVIYDEDTFKLSHEVYWEILEQDDPFLTIQRDPYYNVPREEHEAVFQEILEEEERARQMRVQETLKDKKD